MCGIFGGISMEDPVRTLKGMGAALAHRGPDDSGTFTDGVAALGHRRLSIIDLVTGHQPLVSPDKRHAIVYNGEIYNYKEVREELIRAGQVFRTESDTEVVLAAYRQWHYGCLDRLNGMFAFAVWDTVERRLWLARDRIGKKPLYWMKLGPSFYFASEAKALWRVPGFAAEYDHTAIDWYVTLRYVPGDRTMFRGITKLSAGHWMSVDEGARILQIRRWWDIPVGRDQPPAAGRLSLAGQYDEFSGIFASAVKMRLVSDVPLGLFLSSGIDSSSIAIEMARSSSPTFITVGFGEKTDEVEAAGQLAKTLGGHHYPFFMEEADFDSFPRAVSSMDEPYGDAIILPTFLLARSAAQKVKVILTGDGADEVLGGYIHHGFFRTASKGYPPVLYKMLAAFLRVVPSAALRFLFHYPASPGRLGKERIQSLLSVFPDAQGSYLNFASVFTREEKDNLFSGDFRESLAGEQDPFAAEMDSHFKRDDIGVFDKVLRWDMRTWFPDQTLMKLDRLTMFHSIEGRCPFADYRLIEFFLRLPPAVFQELSRNKTIIRRLYGRSIAGISQQKQAFYLPLHNLFNRRATMLIHEVLSKDNLKKIRWFNADYVSRLIQRRRHSPLLADKQLMNLVVLALWLDAAKNMQTTRPA